MGQVASSLKHLATSPYPTAYNSSATNVTHTIIDSAMSVEHIPHAVNKLISKPSAEHPSRAIVAISMGEAAAKSKMVERFVWSARHKGNYTGWIVLLTDAPKSRYSSFVNWTENFLVMQTRKEDYLTSLEHEEMSRKRFKTFVLEYLATEPKLDHVDLVYYLDIDIVFANDVDPMFQTLEDAYQIGHDSRREILNSGKMWMFEGNAFYPLQGGQMILDRRTSQPCLDLWRWYMDNNLSELQDQVLLGEMVKVQQNRTNDGSRTTNHPQCTIVPMKQDKHIEFPEQGDIRRVAQSVQRSKPKQQQSRHKYSPLVHIRNTERYVRRVKNSNYQAYMKDLLGFRSDEEDALHITDKMLLDK